MAEIGISSRNGLASKIIFLVLLKNINIKQCTYLLNLFQSSHKTVSFLEMFVLFRRTNIIIAASVSTFMYASNISFFSQRKGAVDEGQTTQRF
jgi:hypothetical protein